ncbi:MAG: hypothetical protein U0871_02785 [Gemmataceae bacterium]
MRRPLGIVTVILGGVGVLACAAAVGFGWWGAVKAAGRVTRVADRLDQGLVEAESRLARVEDRLGGVRADLDEIRGAAEQVAAENPDLPRVRSAVERLLDRLDPTIDRAAALADSLRPVAAGLRAAADIATQLGGDPGRVRDAADAIDRAADLLNIPRERIQAVKSAQAARIARELVSLARDAVAGSERLADGLAAARRELAATRGQVSEWRDTLVFWFYVAAAVNTLVWVWGGVGQLCLIGWGLRRVSAPAAQNP